MTKTLDDNVHLRLQSTPFLHQLLEIDFSKSICVKSKARNTNEEIDLCKIYGVSFSHRSKRRVFSFRSFSLHSILTSRQRGLSVLRNRTRKSEQNGRLAKALVVSENHLQQMQLERQDQTSLLAFLPSFDRIDFRLISLHRRSISVCSIISVQFPFRFLPLQSALSAFDRTSSSRSIIAVRAIVQ
ncbi:hypothetical protein L2E82_50541 [Cichorium intybus]|nr:hypothetical protein L2E82_50541 [Cichorium intybus]